MASDTSPSADDEAPPGLPSASAGHASRARVNRRGRMTAFAVLGTLAVVLAAVAWSRGGPALTMAGVREGWSLLLQVGPQIVLGFLVAGLLTVVLPGDLIARWVGEGSGAVGLAVATVAGAITPGGPYMQFPLVATLATAGAGVGPLAAYLTAWSVAGINRVLVWEIPILGAQFAVSRWLVSLLLPPVVGLLVPVVIRLLAPRG